MVSRITIATHNAALYPVKESLQMLWIASCEELRMALMNLNKDIGSKMVKLIKCWYKDVGICCWGEYGSCFLIAQ